MDLHKSRRTFTRYCFLLWCFIQMGGVSAQKFIHPERYVRLYDPAYQHPYPKRWEMIDSIRTISFAHYDINTKEVFLFRSKIAELAAEQHKDEKAMLIAQLAKMDYLQRTSHVPIQEFDQWYQRSLEEADRLDFAEIKMKIAFLYAANLKFNYQKDVLALYYLNKAVEYTYLAKKVTDRQKALHFSGIARIYYQFDDFPHAIEFGKEVEKSHVEKTEKFLTLDVIGASYLKLKKYDSALVYFDKGLKMLSSEFKNDKDKKGWFGILVGKKGHVYKATNQLDSAIRCYEIGIEDTYKNKLLDNTCGFAINLADLFVDRHELAKAEKLILLARQATQSSGNEEDRLQLHRLLTKYYTALGQINRVVLHKDSAQYWAAVIEKRRGKNVQIQADLRLETERRLHLETTLQENIKQQKANRFIAIIIVGLLTAIAFVLVLRYQLLMKLKDKELTIQQQEAEKKLLLEQEKAKQEQIIAQLKLEEFTNIIIAKNKQIELFQLAESQQEHSESVQQLLNNTLVTEEQWANFKALFDKVHVGYLQRLKEKIPGISPAEIRFMALAKLQLSTREMATSLGVSVNAVRNVWFRLRKKVDLPDDATWHDLVKQI